MLDIGRVVDRYTIEALVGRGGMAEVYRVRHNTLDVLYALKVLTFSGKELTARLVAEGRAQSQLQHPNILRVIDVIEVDGQPGLILDYVDGPELGDWIVTNKPDIKTAEAVFRGIASAVQTAHNAGLVHRDLKPANVLIAKGPNGEPIPKVADFGLAKALAGDATLKATRSGLPMGTPAYMPPEQIRDAATVDERADIFALGCILFELVAHYPAFTGPDAMAIFNQVLDGKREPSPPDIPERISRTIDASMQSDRDARLQTCALLLDSLEGAPPATHIAPMVTGSISQDKAVAAGFVAAVLMGGVALATLAGAAAVYWMMSSSGELSGFDPFYEPDPCTSDTQGWVTLSGGGIPRANKPWTARDEAYVHTSPPASTGESPGAALCILSAASTATITEARDDEWVAISAIKLAAPDAEPPTAPPVCYGPVNGWANTRTVFNRPKSGREIWSPTASQPLYADRPTKANDYDTRQATTCELASGSKATISGPHEKVTGTGWWVPISDVR